MRLSLYSLHFNPLTKSEYLIIRSSDSPPLLISYPRSRLAAVQKCPPTFSALHNKDCDTDYVKSLALWRTINRCSAMVSLIWKPSPVFRSSNFNNEFLLYHAASKISSWSVYKEQSGVFFPIFRMSSKFLSGGAANKNAFVGLAFDIMFKQTDAV